MTPIYTPSPDDMLYNKINYLWRLLATGFCFLLFALGGLILGYFIIPIVLTVAKIMRIKKPKKHIAQFCIYLTFRFFTGTMSALGLVKYRFISFDQLKNDKGTLIIANHPTLIDYVSIVAKLPFCDNLVKASLWQNKFIRRVISTAGYIPNIHPEQTFHDINLTLGAGDNLLMFPEGTRSTPHKPIQLKRGAAQIAIRANAPIRIIHLNCEPATLAKNDKWYRIPPTKPVFTLTVRELIDTQALLAACNQLPSVAARRLTRLLEQHLQDYAD
ncbi:lysophospholipid acyltransferase family protein [Caedibacter taeniospiralis]|jgi:1-acyl-sn-glycerol-3-phosphate acyltransferase|uniref:lysophospholipid acyltransferase family protein n=1 Tax=Caedibacter taeniospiralis TaxID=28907 RepID=UPI0037C0195A